VPFEHQESLQHLPGVLSAPHFVPLPKPLIWHTFYKRIAIASHAAAAMKASPTVENNPQKANGNGWGRERSPERSITSGTVNILLVEDNAVNQKLCMKMLTSLGYSVILANDGEQAIEQTRKHDKDIDLILMDQSMPVKDGVCATRDIRVLENSGKLSKRHPIIALTAVVSTESRAQFKSAGADDFLAKPLSFAKLEQTLATFLRIE
jgi:CheY-like chemotaxis protein